MTAFLVIVALLVGGAGLLSASQVSAGPAIVGFACLIAILARIQQAREQYMGYGKPIAGLKCVHCGHVNPVGPGTCEKCGGNLKGGGSVALST